MKYYKVCGDVNDSYITNESIDQLTLSSELGCEILLRSGSSFYLDSGRYLEEITEKEFSEVLLKKYNINKDM